MYDLVLKPVSMFVLVMLGLFLLHVFGPNIAESVCPIFGEENVERIARCTGFFDVLQ